MISALKIKENEDGSKEFLLDEKILSIFSDDKEALIKFIDAISQKDIELAKKEIEHKKEETIQKKEETSQKKEETSQKKEETKQIGFENIGKMVIAGCKSINSVLDGIIKIQNSLNEYQNDGDSSIEDTRTDEEVEEDINKNYVFANNELDINDLENPSSEK